MYTYRFYANFTQHKKDKIMGKPKIPNQKNKYKELETRLNKYVILVEKIYETLNLEAAKAVGRTDYASNMEEPFKWSDYPQTQKQINDIQSRFVKDMTAIIYSGTLEEWNNSNAVQDLVANKVLSSYTAQVNGGKYKQYFQINNDTLKAFQNRKDKGLNLSAKLWNQSEEYKSLLEASISCAIQKGTAATILSKQISKYLLDFQTLQKDYKDKYGKATNIHDCHYQSIRLARNEINMAYREAENERWRQMDFVVGYEIKLSNNHTSRGWRKGIPFIDICDELAGKYPKDFKWTGWHPSCRCYKIPILKTEEEFWAWDGRSETIDSVNEVKDVPDKFKQWIGTNSYRIEMAQEHGTLPYFIKDNEKIVNGILTETPSKNYYMPENTPKERRMIWIENGASIESKIGILQGDAMSLIEANEMKGNSNFIPQFTHDKNGNIIINTEYNESNKPYHENCQSCVVAYELRRRGYDVTALPNLGAIGNIPYELSFKTEDAWINPATLDPPQKINIIGIKKGKRDLKSQWEILNELREQTKSPGRYHVNWKWEGKEIGHIVTFERYKNGKCRWYDAQTGELDCFNKEIYKQIDLRNGISILQVDNLLINDKIIDGIVEKHNNK